MAIRRAQTVACGVGAVLLAAACAACAGTSSPAASPVTSSATNPSATATTDGSGSVDTLPDLLLADLDGAPVAMRSLLAGKPVVLNYWYATCPPCREEMPALGMLAKEFTGRVTFVGINPQDDAATARSVAAERGTAYRQLLDSTQRGVDALGLTGFPTTVVVRADGSIARSIRRAVSAEELRTILDEELTA